MSSSVVTHVLVDADGVLQRHPVGWAEAAAAYVGDQGAELFAAVTALEQACLRGDGDFLPVLGEELARRGHDVDPDSLYASVWLTIETVATSVELVRELRRRGLGVHLATNQHAGRGAYMRSLGYDALFDECFYSCELGAAKPDREFWASVTRRLGVAPEEVLLIDDNEANVAGARAAGLVAVHWHLDEGIDELRARLADHGVGQVVQQSHD